MLSRPACPAAVAPTTQELVAKGLTDPTRVSVGGHSYGAFMAANLVAHCPQLFAAAIARSGECGWLPRGTPALSAVPCAMCIPAALQAVCTHVCVRTCPHARCPAGAYNRTLTPFGFQSEERTLWQAPEVYAKMSPFM